MLKPKKQKKKGNGTFLSTNSGRLVRTTPSYSGRLGTSVETQSIDTTGYSKGKKGFLLKKDSPSSGKSSEYIPRQKLKQVISNLKSGVTKFIDTRIKKGPKYKF